MYLLAMCSYQNPAMRFLFRFALPVLIALLAWAASALQLVLFLHYFAAAGRSFLDALARYSSFFSILANLFVAILLTGALVARDARSLFRRASLQSAAAVYILVVMLVYVLLLRRAWNPQGPQFAAETLLHYIVPMLYTLYWLAGVPKGALAWRDPLRWLAGPLVYFGYVLALGAMRGDYPYRFIDPGALGYPRTLLNGLLLGAAFLAVGLALTALDRAMAKARG
jgi:hypothetical protein